MVKSRIPTILLVEDNDSHAEMILRAIAAGAEPLNVYPVGSLAAAGEFLHQIAPDLILADQSLPDGDGIALIPGDEASRKCPVILMTSHGDEALAAMAIKAGASDYIVKSEAMFAELPHKIWGTLRDWTNLVERKKVEQALKESEKSYRTLAENLPGVVYRVFLQEGRRQYFNRRIETLTGYCEVEGDTGATCSMESLIVPEDRPRVDAELAAAVKAVAPFELTYRIRSRDGNIKYCHERGQVIADENNLPLYIDGVIFDVTAQKETETALADSRQEWQNIIENANVGIYRVTTGGKLLMLNRFMARLFGFGSVGEMMDDIPNIQALYVNIEDRTRLVDGLVADKHVRGVEIPVRHRDGNTLWVRVDARMVADTSGREVVEGFMLDITEEKKLMTRIQQSQKMEAIGELSGGIAHDFNNILTPIIGMSEIIANRPGLDQKIVNYANKINQSAHRAGELVKQILSFGRQAQFERVPVKLQPLIGEVRKLMRATIPSNIQMSYAVDASVGAVMADPTQMHQILMNLITNAYHAVEAMDGEITVELSACHQREGHPGGLTAGVYARLIVADTGPGIPPDIFDKIFDPYFTTKKKGKGTGLGLAVVYGIVKEHGGDIQVSTAVGEGTRFEVLLPVTEQGDREVTQDTASPPKKGNEHILLVDDEDAIVEMYGVQLERLGYKLTTFTSSTAALAAFSKTPDAFDLVITDMTMPKLTGDNLSAELLKIRPDIPIVICTGFSERMNDEIAAEIGVKGLLMKPVTRSEMGGMIRKVLEAS
ncbi:MAG: response regulator [Desulfobacterales bacterium]|nr:response regulator [Desulfobacterales bacterium]